MGANLIARTAWAALGLLHEIRRRTRLEIPLAWSPDALGNAQVIEVYPAGTQKSYRRFDAAQKIEDEVERRRWLATRLVEMVEGGFNSDLIVRNSHVFDAVTCVLAAADFVTGKAIPPEPKFRDLALREGWIWVKEISD